MRSGVNLALNIILKRSMLIFRSEATELYKELGNETCLSNLNNMSYLVVHISMYMWQAVSVTSFPRFARRSRASGCRLPAVTRKCIAIYTDDISPMEMTCAWYKLQAAPRYAAMRQINFQNVDMSLMVVIDIIGYRGIRRSLSYDNVIIHSSWYQGG